MIKIHRYKNESTRTATKIIIRPATAIIAVAVVVFGRLFGVLRSLIHIRVFISSVVLIVVIVVGVVILVVVGRSSDQLAGEIENGARYHELLEKVSYFVVVSGAHKRIGAIIVWRTPIAIRSLAPATYVAGALVLLLLLDHVHGEALALVPVDLGARALVDDGAVVAERVLVVRVERERHLVGLGEQRVGEEGVGREVELEPVAVGRLGVHSHAHVALVALRDHVANDVRVGERLEPEAGLALDAAAAAAVLLLAQRHLERQLVGKLLLAGVGCVRRPVGPLDLLARRLVGARDDGVALREYERQLAQIEETMRWI